MRCSGPIKVERNTSASRPGPRGPSRTHPASAPAMSPGTKLRVTQSPPCVWAPSPSTRRACGGTQTLPLQGAGVGTARRGTWLWLRTRSSQMTRNTMSPGNEFRSNKEVTGEDEGSGPRHGRCGSGLVAGVLAGSSARRQATRVCPLTSVIQRFFSDVHSGDTATLGEPPLGQQRQSGKGANGEL